MVPTSPRKLHQPRKQTQGRIRRDSASARGYGNRWRQTASTFVRAYPFCVLCLCRGRVNEGARNNPSPRGRSLHCDHITPHYGDRRLLFDQANLQTLCATPCHATTKRRIELSTDHVRHTWLAHLASELVRTESMSHLLEHRQGLPDALLTCLIPGHPPSGGVSF